MDESVESVTATKDWPKKSNDYILGEAIGIGATAVINAAFCKSRREECAIKRFNIKKEKREMIALNEIEIMRTCNHKNIIKFFTSFMVKEELWLITSLAEGSSLLDIMKHKMKRRNCSRGVFSEEVIATVSKQVLNGLVYLHSNGCIHRDIKAANIFVNKDGTVVIGDLGSSALLPTDKQHPQSKILHHCVGTRGWMAPEVKEKNRGYDYKADIWSFGITTIEVATGRAPYQSYVRTKAIKLAIENKPPTLNTMYNREHWYKRYGKSIRSMISYCLQTDPEKRPNAVEVLKHQFFNKAKDKEFLVENLMKWAPPLGWRVQTLRKIKPSNGSSKWRQLSTYFEEQPVSIDEEKKVCMKNQSIKERSSSDLQNSQHPVIYTIKFRSCKNIKVAILHLIAYLLQLLARLIIFPD